jgi:hypothetical protein
MYDQYPWCTKSYGTSSDARQVTVTDYIGRHRKPDDEDDGTYIIMRLGTLDSE